MIHVIATVKVQEGKREGFLEEFRKVVPLVLAEDGCIEYGPTVDLKCDIGAPGFPREDVVTILEKWESLDHLKAHLSTQHMMDYRVRVKDLVDNVQLQILEPAG